MLKLPENPEKKLDMLFDLELEYRKRRKEDPTVSKMKLAKEVFNYDRSRFYQIRMEFNHVIKKLYGSVDKLIDKIEAGEITREEAKERILEELKRERTEGKEEQNEDKTDKALASDIRKELDKELLSDLKHKVEVKEEEQEDEVEEEAMEEEKKPEEKKGGFFRSKWFWIILIGGAGITVTGLILKMMSTKKEIKKIQSEMATQSPPLQKTVNSTRRDRYTDLGLPPEF